MGSYEDFLAYHSDDTMEPLDDVWVWVPPESYGGRWGFYRRETDEEKALRVLGENGMLPVVTQEEVPDS